MKDGLYQVRVDRTRVRNGLSPGHIRRPSFCAGFVIKNGQLAECASILRRRFDYWCQFAKWIGP